jgi:hypothetical protein
MDFYLSWDDINTLNPEEREEEIIRIEKRGGGRRTTETKHASIHFVGGDTRLGQSRVSSEIAISA